MMDRKTICAVAICLLSLSVRAGISEKYDDAYMFSFSKVVTTGQETVLSPYKDGKIIFVSEGKVYEAKLDTLTEDVQHVMECPDFTLLHITGTVAYDAKRNRLYYSAYSEKYKNDYLFESVTDSNGVWQLGSRMRIQGTQKARTQVNFVQSAGWNYPLPYIGGFYNPAMAKSGDRIYFSSTMQGGQGQRDIYYVDIEDEEQRVWSYPQPVVALNTAGDDDWLFVEGDSSLYLSSTVSGESKVYYSHFVDSVWTQPVAMDSIYNQGMSRNLLISQGAPALLSDREGGSRIFLYQLRPIVPEPEVVEEPIVITFPWTFFLFDFDKSTLTPRFLREIDAMVEAIKLLPESTRFVIEGHTDQRGSDKYNENLSYERANEVKRQLVSRGVDPNRLTVIGYGKTRPVYANPQNEEEFYQNRRVIVDIVE